MRPARCPFVEHGTQAPRHLNERVIRYEVAAYIVDLLEMIDINYHEHMHSHAGELLKAGFNALSGRTRVARGGRPDQTALMRSRSVSALFRVGIAISPTGIRAGRFVEMATAWTRHQKKPRGLARGNAIRPGGVPRLGIWVAIGGRGNLSTACIRVQRARRYPRRES